tara:strand:+ start:869 stop:1384 length:516 start_codon:yes stop_codon:yes gene_type:complete
MVKVLIIDKFGNINEIETNKLTKEDLYKKCNYRKSKNFEMLHKWVIKKYIIELHGKREGKANFENKYEFPPPIDNELYFGSLALVNVNEEGEMLDICKNEWLKIYKNLYGGFENLADTAEEDELEIDELKNIPIKMKTSGGYLKDGFVVDDDICNYDSELDYEEYEFSDED